MSGDDDRGAVTALELVLLVPAFVVLLVFVTLCGRMGRTAQVVHHAAERAARAASLARTPAGAQAAASAALNGNVSSGDLACEPPALFYGDDGHVHTVTVRVRCTTSAAGLAPLTTTGKTYTAAATEPFDLYREG
jgi:Flp pilus assembly protein TadG